MKFNTKTRYGIRVMLEIAIHSSETKGIYQKDIAIAQELSFKYLDQIISDLKKSNLIRNIGGRNSGYILSRSPEKISMLDIFAAFDKDVCMVHCLTLETECPHLQTCATKYFWNDLNQTMKSVFENYTLDTLVAKHNDLKSPLNLNVL